MIVKISEIDSTDKTSFDKQQSYMQMLYFINMGRAPINIIFLFLLCIIFLTIPTMFVNGFVHSEEVDIKMQLEPDTDAPLEGYFIISDFHFIPTNSTSLCPTAACEYKLENTHVLFQFESKKDKNLIGTFKIDTGESTIINEMRTDLT
ncbi:MAG TPA: hypothetical protein VFV86_06015, partial [Nitrososphaeraceae archaeon]|nr:hypothetical protein [Nitrososphaeraceae archaeon]